MKDRESLNAYLKDAQFPVAGDLVFPMPVISETKEVHKSEKSVLIVISAQARQGRGSIIDPAGVRLDRFRKNPVVLYSHDYEGLPVAKSLWERVRFVDGRVEIITKTQFHRQTELSREVWELVEKGLLSSWSLGIIPQTWGRTKDGRGFRVAIWDLLEYSCVPTAKDIPALTRERDERRISAPSLLKSISAQAGEEVTTR